MEKWKTLTVKKNDVIVFYVDTDKYSRDTLSDLFNKVKNYFPNNKCVMIPSKFDLQTKSKEEIIKWLNK